MRGRSARSNDLLVGRPENPSNLAWLDVVRGGGALYVVAYHTVVLLTESGRHFHERGGSLGMILSGNPAGLLGFGFPVLLSFFVLSGFVIHLRLARNPDQLEPAVFRSWARSYACRRAMRIYPPLCAAILATYILDSLGFRLFPDLYGQVFDHPTGGELVSSVGTLKEAVLTAVPVLGAGAFGSNGALWSIGWELWFYLAYIPIVALIIMRPRLKLGALLLASIVLAAAVATAMVHARFLIPDRLPLALIEMSIYFPSWLVGAYLAELYARGTLLRRPLLVAAAGVAALGLAATVSDNGHRPEIDWLSCLGVVLIIAALVLRSGEPSEANQVRRAVAASARLSYSLYLVHVPVLFFMYGVLGTGTRPLTSPVRVAVIYVTTVAAGLLMYVLVERPSVRLFTRPFRSASASAAGPPGHRADEDRAVSVSIALATYNGERFLPEQLASLAAQTHLPTELVACDDGSTDGTLDVLHDFARRAPFPVRIFRNAQRLGFADNFLKAASLCRGRLIAFCDQDDVWLENKLERCVAAFDDPGCRLVLHTASVVDVALRPVGSTSPSSGTLRKLRALTPWPDAPGFAMVFSADLLALADPSRRPQDPIVPDEGDGVMCHDTWVVFMANALRGVVVLDEPLVLYRQHDQNVAGAPPQQRLGNELAESRKLGARRYRWLADRAGEWAAHFSGCSPTSREDVEALRRATAFYGRVAERNATRAVIHERARPRRERLCRLVRLLLAGGYFDSTRAGLGYRSLIKDALVILVGPVLSSDQPAPSGRNTA